MGRALAVAALLLVAGCRGDAGPGVGDLVPDLEMYTRDGAPVRLASWRGRTVVLNAWAPWCPPCVAEMPSLQRLADRLDPQRFAVVGLAPGSDEYLVDEFLRKQAIRFDNLIDRTGRALPEELGVDVYPQTFVIGADGRLLARIVGQRRWDESPWLERITGWGAATDKKKEG